jgi:transposase
VNLESAGSIEIDSAVCACSATESSRLESFLLRQDILDRLPKPSPHIERRNFRFKVAGYADAFGVAAAVANFKVARSTVYNWLARYRQSASMDELADRSRAPHKQPHAVPVPVRKGVVRLLKKGWSSPRIVSHLARRQIRVSASSVQRIARRIKE